MSFSSCFKTVTSMLLLLVVHAVFAQAPNISYASPQNYALNNAIAPLVPINTGGAVPVGAFGQVSTINKPNIYFLRDAVATGGNVYVSNQNFNQIWKVDATGAFSVFAGSVTPGAINGVGTTATFYLPTGIVTDASGNLYISDRGNNLIRKITPAGVVSTFAGSGARGATNGTAASASFYDPYEMVIDAFGNMFIAETGNHLIRKISPTGIVSTFAGSGTQGQSDGIGTAASFGAPYGIAMDVLGNIYITDSYYNSVRKVTPAGVVTTLAGGAGKGSANGTGAAASFDFLTGLTIDAAANLYVLDSDNNQIRMITPSGVTTTFAGSLSRAYGSADGFGTAATFSNPTGISNDGQGNLYVADNTSVRKITLYGFVIDKSLPAGLTFDTKTGTISGVPTTASPAITYTVTAYNSMGSSVTTIVIAVLSAAQPVITSSTIIKGLNTFYGGASLSNSFTVTGSNLSTGILVTPPVGFEVSADNVTFANTVTVGSAGTVTVAPVYIRLTALAAAGVYQGNIMLTAGGASSVSVPVPVSIVTPAPLTITANPVTKIYGTALSGGAGSTAYVINNGGLQNGETITTVTISYTFGALSTDTVGIYPGSATASAALGANGFLISNYNITYRANNITVTPAMLTVIASDVSKPYGTTLTSGPGSSAFTTIGLQNNEVISSVTVNYGNGDAATDPVGLYNNAITPSAPMGGTFLTTNYVVSYKPGNISVTLPVTITASGTIAPSHTVYGTPSPSSTFTVSGIGLSAGILISPPTGFEVSADNVSFTSSVTIGTGGTVPVTPVYIRLAALTPVGNYSGKILISSNSVTNTNELVALSNVTPAPLIVTADSKSKVAGSANPPLTISYLGFVLNQTVAGLIVQATAITTAVLASPAGQYAITPSGAVAPNYSFTYLNGVLTVSALPQDLTIPNTFTPNGDGVNDTWNIATLSAFTNCTVDVYNRNGQSIFHSLGYSKPWDGTCKLAPLPAGAYYYVIDLKNGKPLLSGSVSVVK